MKTRNVLFSVLLVVTSLTTVGFVQWTDIDPSTPARSSCFKVPIYDSNAKVSLDFDFVYKIDNRFVNTITKSQLIKAKAITDIIPAEHLENVESFHNIQVSTFAEGQDNSISARNKDGSLNEDQKEILRSLEYGSGFSMTGTIKEMNLLEARIVFDTLVYYMSVIPEQSAIYPGGNDALITYLKTNSAKTIAIARRGQIRNGKIGFTVTKNGGIDQVKLLDTSGYSSIDEKMLELIRQIPGTWKAAKNKDGKKVDQELTFFFGMMGC